MLLSFGLSFRLYLYLRLLRLSLNKLNAKYSEKFHFTTFNN